MTPLPVAGRDRVRRAAYGLLADDRRSVLAMVVLNALAAIAGLAGPWLLGDIVDAVAGGRATAASVDRLAFAILLCTGAQLVLARTALVVGYRFGERTAARVRDRFLDRVLGLRASVAERVPTGDLAVRGTSDVGAVATTLRDALPEVLIAAGQAIFVLVAVFVVSPLLGAVGVLCLSGAAVATRWYLRRAPDAYLAEGAAGSALADELTATLAGARTVETLSLRDRRLAAGRDAIDEAHRTRRHTLYLRTVFFPAVDVSYVVPVVAVLLLGGLLYMRDLMTLGEVTAAALYLRQLATPLDAILVWLEQLQSSGASFARLEGLAALPAAAAPAGPAPAGNRIEVRGARFAYDGGRDVLRGIDLTVRPGERLAVVGPSGAGKSTLGRLLAGVDRPRTGTVTVGGAPIADLPPRLLRRQVVLVTQEHHVFRGTLRDNLTLAADVPDGQLIIALASVGADWVADLPAGLDTVLGGDGVTLDGARAQQLALARVVLADPHTLVLDEATALLDPAKARATERALAAVLEERTVIAIAHRLQTAHDADRVAVLDAGRLVEIGTHDELVAAGGTYAALWRTWHG